MDQGYRRSRRNEIGGILSLKAFIDEHQEALEYDLITSAGIELEDVGGSLSWGAFASFVKNLSFDSAVWRSAHPDLSEWSTVLKTNIILADIYDILASINANLCGGFAHKKAQRPKTYPRPWLKEKSRKLGRGAMPKNELRKWFEEKRKRKGKTNG